MDNSVMSPDDIQAHLEYTDLIIRQSMEYARDLNEAMIALQFTNSELQKAHIDTIHRLALTAEYKDNDTGIHIRRISEYCRKLGEYIGLNGDSDILAHAAPMHDLGKVGIPDRILLKNDRLTTDEFEIIKTHTVIGSNILSGSKSPILQAAQVIARSHHERWDGSGYPDSRAGEDIPLFGRIVTVADVFDALTSKRPYKEAFPFEQAVDIIAEGAGSQFDPAVISVFVENLDEIRDVHHRNFEPWDA